MRKYDYEEKYANLVSTTETHRGILGDTMIAMAIPVTAKHVEIPKTYEEAM